MSAARSRLEGASEGLFWTGLVLGTLSPFMTFIGAGLTGAGHGSPAGYYVGLGVAGFAWFAFLGSFVSAFVVRRRGGSGPWLLFLPALGVFVYPFIWFYVFTKMF